MEHWFPQRSIRRASAYKNDWVTSAKNWDSTGAFLKREELPDTAALSLTAVRTQTVGNKTIYIIGWAAAGPEFPRFAGTSRRDAALLYRNLEPTFVASALTDANGGRSASRDVSILDRADSEAAPGSNQDHLVEP